MIIYELDVFEADVIVMRQQILFISIGWLSVGDFFLDQLEHLNLDLIINSASSKKFWHSSY